jgi:hypothetical protein
MSASSTPPTKGSMAMINNGKINLRRPRKARASLARQSQGVEQSL